MMKLDVGCDKKQWVVVHLAQVGAPGGGIGFISCRGLREVGVPPPSIVQLLCCKM